MGVDRLRKNKGGLVFVIIVALLLFGSAIAEMGLVFRVTSKQTNQLGMDKLEVIGGKAYVTIVFSRSASQGGTCKIDQVRAAGRTFSGWNTFTIPVELNANNTVVARTMAMSQPHWVAYTIYIRITEPGESEQSSLSDNTQELDEEAPDVMGLESTGETKSAYSNLFRIFNYADGYYLIEVNATRYTIRDTEEYKEAHQAEEAAEESAPAEEADEEAAEGGVGEEEGEAYSAEDSVAGQVAKLYGNDILKYLVIPADKEIPAGMDKEVIIIRQPVENVYLSSENAYGLLEDLDLTDRLASVGLKAEDVTSDSLKKLLEKDEKDKDYLPFAGSYDDWDLKTLIKTDAGLAIQSSEILPDDEDTIEEDLENLQRLGSRSAQLELAMFIDRSRDEKNDLAKAEWYKVYGIIFDEQEKAEKLYDAAVAKASASEKEKALAELED